MGKNYTGRDYIEGGVYYTKRDYIKERLYYTWGIIQRKTL